MPVSRGHIDLLDPIEDHDLNRGLVGWWLPLDGLTGSNTLYDLCGRNNGTLVNGPTWGPGSGEFGALKYNGTNNYVQVPDFPSTAAVTIVADVELPSFAGNHMFVNRQATNTRFNLFMETGSLKLRGGSQTSVDAGTPSPGRRRLVGTISGTTGTLYVDGVQVATGGVTAVPADTGWLIFGAFTDFGGGYYTSALQHSVSIHDRALPASEVAFLYDQSMSDYPELIRRQPTARSYVEVASPPPPPASSTFLPAFAAGW